jgi:predicted aminopeptidase
MDSGYEKVLQVVGKRHDLIGVVLNDKRENEIPRMGLVKFVDAENGKERWIDTSEKRTRFLFEKLLKKNRDSLRSLFLSSRLDSIDVQTGQDFIKPLVRFFRMRERRW